MLLLILYDILSKRILIDLESDSWPLWIFDEPQVASLICLREDEHVRDRKLASYCNEILQGVLLRLLQLACRERVKQVAGVLQKLLCVEPNTSSLDHESYTVLSEFKCAILHLGANSASSGTSSL